MASRVANFIIMVGLGLCSTLRFRMVSDPGLLILMKFIDLFLIFSINSSHLAMLGRLMDLTDVRLAI